MNETAEKKSDLQISMQYTPNPSAFKFILSQDVKTGGTAAYKDILECDNDLARALINLPAIEHIYFFDNVITVTLNPSVPIEEMRPRIEDAIRNEIPFHDPGFETPNEKKAREYDENTPEEIKRINEILDRTIRPGLQADGGDLEIVSYIHPEITIRYHGACGNCPSSLMGTLHAITMILREEFDQEVDVIPV